MVVKADITIDIDKQIGDLQNLTGLYNARVGDTTPLTIQWYKNGIPLNVQGLHAFITGHVGDGNYNSTTDTIDFPRDTPLVQASDDGRGTLTSGLTTLLIPKQMWQKSGIFSGYVGLKSNSGAIYTGKNIWFKVLGNVLESGIEINYFVDDFEKALSEANGKLNEALEKLKDNYDREVADHEKALLDDTTRLRRLAQDVGELSSQISANNIVKKSDYDKDIEEVKESINLRLSKMNTNPVGVPNSDYLLTNYPDGADGLFITADTGHKWLWLSGVWTDCGEYQAIGIGNELIDPIKQQQKVDEENIATNYSLINQNTVQIKKNTTDIQSIEGAGQLTDIVITDQAGNHITDNYGNRIGGYKWLPLTDVTLTQAGLPADGQAVGEAITDILDPHAERYDIPVLYLYSRLIPSLTDKSTALENQVRYKFPKYGISGVLKKLKVQGRTSAGLPEKNYTLNFDKKTTIFSDFGYQNKYVIKANYTDFSQAKNVVSAKVWGAVRHQHDTFEAIQTNAGDYLTDEAGNHIQGICDPQLSIGKTAGAIDGFPIALYVNDKFAGLYTFNIPKDDWMAKMPNQDGYAMVSVDWSNLDHQVDTTNTSDFGDVEIEFCGTTDTAWVQKSFNNIITALNQDYTDQSHFDMAIDPLLDLDSAIDYYCYSVLIDNIDGINSNFIFQTFDKTKWYIAAYDLDKTYGTTTDFETVIRPNSDNQNADLQQGIKHYGITFENMAKNSKLFSQLWKLHKDDVLNRTKELISTVMSPEEIACMFYDFTQKIPLALYNADAKRWPQKPYTSLLNSNQISLWYSQRINFIKQKYLSDKGEK